MSCTNTPALTKTAKAELERCFRSAINHTLRMRRQLVLLKAEDRLILTASQRIINLNFIISC